MELRCICVFLFLCGNLGLSLGSGDTPESQISTSGQDIESEEILEASSESDFQIPFKRLSPSRNRQQSEFNPNRIYFPDSIPGHLLRCVCRKKLQKSKSNEASKSQVMFSNSGYKVTFTGNPNDGSSTGKVPYEWFVNWVKQNFNTSKENSN